MLWKLVFAPLPHSKSKGGSLLTAASIFQTFLAGDYQVYVAPFEALQNSYVESVRFGQFDALSRELYIDNPPSSELQIVLGENGGSIGGRVLKDRQAGIPNAVVVLVPDSGAPARLDLYKSATTNASGEFQLQGIAPGDYSLFAWQDVDKDAWLNPNFMRLFRPFATNIRIGEGDNPAVEFLFTGATGVSAAVWFRCCAPGSRHQRRFMLACGANPIRTPSSTN